MSNINDGLGRVVSSLLRHSALLVAVVVHLAARLAVAQKFIRTCIIEGSRSRDRRAAIELIRGERQPSVSQDESKCYQPGGRDMLFVVGGISARTLEKRT